jgi:hypothetical protein
LPITNAVWVRARLCKLQKGCIRLAAASDKTYQLLAHGRCIGFIYTNNPQNKSIIAFDFWCFNATFSNISAISWRPSHVRKPEMGQIQIFQ